MKIPAQMFLQEYRFLQGLIGNVQTPHIYFFLFNWRIWAKIGNNSQQILTKLQLKKLIIIKRYSMFVYEGT